MLSTDYIPGSLGLQKRCIGAPTCSRIHLLSRCQTRMYSSVTIALSILAFRHLSLCTHPLPPVRLSCLFYLLSLSLFCPMGLSAVHDCSASRPTHHLPCFSRAIAYRSAQLNLRSSSTTGLLSDKRCWIID